MTTRRIMLTIATDETGAKCSPECMRWHETPTSGNGAYHQGEWCDEFGAMYGDGERSPACIKAERAAREAEAAAVKRGYDLRDEWDADDRDVDLAPHALAHVIDHIRSGK
jgi:hypothetical protein